MNRVNFSIADTSDHHQDELLGGDEWVLIQDDFDENNPTMTITNGAEEVIERLGDKIKGKRLFYIDTEGQIDELIHKDGQFIKFKAGHEGVEF